MQPFLETIAILVLLSVVAAGRDAGIFGAVVMGTALILGIRRYRQKKWNNAAAYAILLVTLFGFAVLGNEVAAAVAVLFTFGRFALRFAKWAFYERLYITNRRIIGLQGFLGSEISTMPLTRVTDISYKTTVWAELFGYGILRVETAGQDQALGLIDFLGEPERFYDLLIDRTTAAVGSVTDPLDEDDGDDDDDSEGEDGGTDHETGDWLDGDDTEGTLDL